MKIQSIVSAFIVLAVFAFAPSLGFSQITSLVKKVLPTEYSSGPQDSIHVFCGEKGDKNASLTATAPNGESGSFEWQKYNAGIFDFFRSETGNSTSTILELEDGCYRVSITSTSGITTYTAWVFNNYLETTAEISNSDCNSFALKGTLISPSTLTYVDLPTGQTLTLGKDIKYSWTGGDIGEKNFSIYKVDDPPTKDTDFTFKITDKFDCVFDTVVRYISIVTKASFSHTEQKQYGLPSGKKEAPLTVTFTNTSENGDGYNDFDEFEWFIFKDLDEIKKEAAANQGKVKDSILVKYYNINPIHTYTFDRPGSYKVKLVSKNHTCSDTTYIDDYIKIDTSFIEAPNFFTPGNDGNNDNFVVQFISMKSVKISIFNRWGKVIHIWESNNVQGFGGSTEESVPQSVWDGKVGGRLATPGVYYYVVEGIGRDDRRQRTSGFFHLFRGK